MKAQGLGITEMAKALGIGLLGVGSQPLMVGLTPGDHQMVRTDRSDDTRKYPQPWRATTSAVRQ
jgi:hypothetical protein